MTGESSAFKQYTKEESLKTWMGARRPGFEGNNSQTAAQPLNLFTDVVELSDQARAAWSAGQSQSSAITETDAAGEFTLSDQDEQKIQLIQKMLEALTGKKIKFYMLKRIKLSDEKTALNAGAASAGSPVQQRQGWGLEYDLHESYQEQAKMSFAAQGIVKTADGREIDFTVQLNMSREFSEQHSVRIRAGDAAKVDPLVINFNGTAPELTSTKFSFDLDADGQEDQISFLGPGSGFLTVDLDGDGQVDNGSELFGPNTGDGFAELAQYDEDGNNWIDENDSIYERLRIWTKDQDGKDVLFALGQKGVGAIFLGNTSTPFEMKDSANKLQGQVQSSGIFLYENGQAGTIQQIDLAV
jgi:hypothetical protein